MSTMTDIGKRLKAARKAAGFKNVAEFTEKHNLPLTTYSPYEGARRVLSVELLFRYSKFLNVSPAWLLTGEGRPYEPLFYSAEKEEILYAELSRLGIDIEDVSESDIKSFSTELIDRDLMFEIFTQLVPLVSEKNAKPLSGAELLEFCMETYNNIAKVSSNPAIRKKAVAMSASVFKNSIIKK